MGDFHKKQKPNIYGVKKPSDMSAESFFNAHHWKDGKL